MEKNITIDETIPHINYIADGLQTTFVFPFLIFESGNICVYIDNIKTNEGFSIEFSTSETGGSVIFGTPPAKDTVISIVRELSIKRVSDFQEGGEIRSKALNYEFNYQIACTQQIAEALNRSFLLPVYSNNSGLKKEFPQPSPNKAIIWNNDGTGLTNSKIQIDEFNDLMTTYHSETLNAAQNAQASATSAQTSATESQNAFEKAKEEAQLAQQASRESRFLHIGSIISFDHPASYAGLLPLNDPNYAEGYLISGCDSGYPDFWTEMLRLKALSINNEEYAQYAKTQEEYTAELLANTDESGNSYCRFYVVDEENKSVRLPYFGNKESNGLYFYIVIANKFENVSEAQFASIQNLIDQKVGEAVKTDLSNVMPGIDFVVESWSEGESWYRRYKSGWLEQGGYAFWTDNSLSKFPVNLLQPYRDTNYHIQTTLRCYTNQLDYYGNTFLQTTTGFRTRSVSTEEGEWGIIWRAYGYGAEQA